MAFRFRHSICNEVYKGWDFATACRHMRSMGYEGIEIAPFTLAEDPARIPPAERREYRDIITAEGLSFVGLHWLMVAPPGLHVATPDQALRERSWLHIRNLVDLCGDLGPNGVMVFGSPAQRAATGSSTPEEARERFVEGLTAVAGHAAERGVRILVEALPKAQCDVINRLEEAAGIVRRIGSPGVRTMFDTHNAVDETEPHAVLVERYFELIEHIHVNETDGKHCGAGDYDFAPLLASLKRLNYGGWISLEAFDFSPGAERIAGESIRHLQGVIDKL
ncbi:MAG: sugar phosphate isomerase/epimerase family protein [Bryobacteraceae bacterium]|jgi:sugar phosphate isomerase/epimerase